MGEIKISTTHPEHYIKIEWMTFHAFLLHVRRGEILDVHLRSNRRNLSVMICISVVHQSH